MISQRRSARRGVTQGDLTQQGIMIALCQFLHTQADTELREANLLS